MLLSLRLSENWGVVYVHVEQAIASAWDALMESSRHVLNTKLMDCDQFAISTSREHTVADSVQAAAFQIIAASRKKYRSDLRWKIDGKAFSSVVGYIIVQLCAFFCSESVCHESAFGV